MNALRKKVLVVDDDPVIGRSFSRVLSERGYAVVTAQDGREALEKIAREDYDVVYTDIKMPGPDGLEVTGRIRKRRPWIPVVIVTGYGTDANKARAEELGVADFLCKPLTPEMIEDSARRVLLEKEAAAASIDHSLAAETTVAGAQAEESLLKNIALFFAAPFVGLAYILAFPLVGIGILAWMGVKALAKRSTNVLPVLKNVGLFVAAPFLGLAYLVGFPFIGLAALAWLGIRAMTRRSTRE